MSVTEVDLDDLQEETAAVRKAAEEHDMRYPTLLDAGGQWMASAGISSVPTFVVIAKDGHLAYRYRGSVKPGSDAHTQLEAAVVRALDAG